MKPLFEGYYDPTEVEIRALWEDALIVLDTNVLLNLYRVSSKTREEIKTLLESQKHRLWIPYQVAVEFQRNRLKALRDEYDKAKALAATVNKAHATFRQSIQGIEFGERGSGEEVEAIMRKIADSVGELSKLASALPDGYVSPSAEDPINTFLTSLLDGRVGDRPRDQGALDECYSEAAERYAVGMGPGYLDQAKAGDRYMADGLIYDRQYGDYLLWKQLLHHVAANPKRKGVLLVTSDVKEDWWQDTKTVSGLRPQPELVMDIRRRAGVSSFWMYTLADFVKKSKQFLHSKVSDDTISDVEQADSNSGLYKFVSGVVRDANAASELRVVPFTLALPAMAEALGSTRLHAAGRGAVVAIKHAPDEIAATKYALMDVTARPKSMTSIGDLSSTVDAAVEALGDNDCLVLYDAFEPQDFWLTVRWGGMVARMVAGRVPFLLEVRGATLVDGSIVFTTLLDERLID
jgi:rRNA-processing protein FCF1